jgi:hypothetical protein
MTAQTEVTATDNNVDHTMTEDPHDAADINAAAPYGENLSIETATDDVQRAFEDYPDEHPFNLHFHPAVEQPIVAFDPSLIQDAFDPFDLADFINSDI